MFGAVPTLGWVAVSFLDLFPGADGVVSSPAPVHLSAPLLSLNFSVVSTLLSFENQLETETCCISLSFSLDLDFPIDKKMDSIPQSRF